MAGVAYRQIQDDNDGWVLRTPLQGGGEAPPSGSPCTPSLMNEITAGSLVVLTDCIAVPEYQLYSVVEE